MFEVLLGNAYITITVTALDNIEFHVFIFKSANNFHPALKVDKVNLVTPCIRHLLRGDFKVRYSHCINYQQSI